MTSTDLKHMPRWSDLYSGDMLGKKNSDDLYILERKIPAVEDDEAFLVYVFLVENHREVAVVREGHLAAGIESRGYYLVESNNFF